MRFAAFAASLAIVALFVSVILVDGSLGTAISHDGIYQSIAFWGAVFGVVIAIGAGLLSYSNTRAAKRTDTAADRLPDYSALLHKLNAARNAGDAAAYGALSNSEEARHLLADDMLAGDREAFRKFITLGQAVLSGDAQAQGQATRGTLDHAFFNLTQALQRREIALRDGASVREVSRMKAVE